MEKEAERYHKNQTQEKDLSLKMIERENYKLKEMVRKLTPFDSYRTIMEILEKENKFDGMAIKCQ